MNQQKTRRLVWISLLGAISSILMLFEIVVPFVPTFIKLDISDVPVLLGGFLLGPVSGIYIALIKVLLHFVLKGSSTLGIGELVNFIGSVMFMLPAVLYYYRNRTNRRAIQSLLLGTCIVTITLLLLNYFVMFPLYASVMHFPLEAIVAATNAVNSFVTDTFTLMVFALLPFNLLKYVLASVLTYILYERVKPIIRGY